MKLVIPVLILSFFGDGVLSSVLSLHSLFLPLFSVVALVLIYPYFRGKKTSYLKYCFIVGLFYDFAYMDTFLLNVVLFTFVGIFVLVLNYWFTNNLLNNTIMGVLSIIFYRFISYLFYLILVPQSFSWFSLLQSIYLSLITNIIFLILVYIIMDKISQKCKIPKQV